MIQMTAKVQHLISIMVDDMKRLAMGDTACFVTFSRDGVQR